MSELDRNSRIFHTWQKFTRYQGRVNLFPVNFNQSWTQVITRQKVLFGLCLTNTGLVAISNSVTPVFIGLAIASGNTTSGILLFIGLLGVRLVSYALYYLDPILQLQTQYSVTAASHELLLQVDPLNHTYRSSGQILSKVNRGSIACRDLVLQIQTTVFSLLISALSVSLVLGFYNIGLGFLAFGFVFLCCALSFCITNATKNIADRASLEAEDKASSVNVESLQQVQYIRSMFATTEQIGRIRQTNLEAAIVKSARWNLGGTTITITQLIFLITFRDNRIYFDQ